MRHRWLIALLLLIMVLSVSSASAAITVIDPFQPPQARLTPPEIETLEQLQDSVFPFILSPLSPDDQAALTVEFSAQDIQFVLLDINDGSAVPVDPIILQYPPFSEIVWRDANTLTYFGAEFGSGPDGSFQLQPLQITINRADGTVQAQPTAVPVEFFLSLAPNATRALIVQIEQTDEATVQSLDKQQTPFPLAITRQPYTPRLINAQLAEWSKYRKLRTFNWEDLSEVRVASVSIKIALYDIATAQTTELVDLPEGSGLYSAPGWTKDASKVAFSRITFPNIGREGTRLGDITTQAALGNYSPSQDPFVQNNVVDVFDFTKNDPRVGALNARDGNGDLFSRVAWSPGGERLMVQQQRAARLDERKHPVSLFPERSYLRFFDADLKPTGMLDRAQIEAPNTAFPFWVDDDNIFITAPYGLNYRMFRYNVAQNEFNAVPTSPGTIYTALPTNTTQQLVFLLSSFQHPPELYKTNWTGTTTTQVTNNNAAIKALNQIRVDEVSFTLANGAVRRGFLLQPADATFPPRNISIVHWQQGGPGGTITNEWGSRVEQPFNLLPNFGVAMLVVPLPGREGWGPDFYNALADGRNFGQIDIDEGAEIMQQLIAQGYTARGKVGMTGCSYGGYFTSQSITRHPDVYTAANTQCTLLDLLHEWQVGYTPVISYLMGRVPTSDTAEYLKDSPVYNTEKVTAKTLIFHGSFDFLPVTIAQNFHDSIEQRGTRVDMLQFDYEGHGLGFPSSQSTAAQAQIEWFRQYLARLAGYTVWTPVISNN